jgi:hypothetical protein
MKSRCALGVLAFIVPAFALAFVRHLILFKHYYEDLAICRTDINISFRFPVDAVPSRALRVDLQRGVCVA